MPRQSLKAETVAEAYLALLKDRGVDYLFGNAGTDFASVIEALAKAGSGASRAPTPITVPHENVAVAMAHGYYLATGRPAAVMVHVTVGTANAVCGVMNAARENVPILFTAGRTPITEEGPAGTRSLYIHWGQEMFDQGGMVRELVKWDYELRRADQVESVVDRAITVAMSEPRGPIYLTLPREVLAADATEVMFDSPARRAAAHAAAPDADAIDRAADILAKAASPLIIVASAGQNHATVPALSQLAERFALPVVAYRPRYVNLPSDHPMLIGYESGAAIKDADAILIVDCDVPWIPSLHKPRADAKVIQIGADPMFSRYPLRGYPCDLAITGTSALTLPALTDALETREKAMAAGIAARRKRVAEAKEKAAGARKATLASAAKAAPLHLAHVADCINAVKGADDVVVSESQLPLAHIEFTKPGTLFSLSPAGGLGWGVGCALGVKLGAPDRTVFSVVGDGSYMFGNPTPAHYVSAANELPVLTVILNNAMWGSVRKATLGIHPDGAAAKANRAPLTYLEPSPAYHKVVEASGGYGEEVRTPDQLPKALERGLKAVTVEKRQAVLNVHTSYDDAAALADARR
jgi:acetolactate synthase-1/2/3 large subunit